MQTLPLHLILAIVMDSEICNAHTRATSEKRRHDDIFVLIVIHLTTGSVAQLWIIRWLLKNELEMLRKEAVFM